MQIKLENVRKSYYTPQGKKEILKGSNYVFENKNINIIKGVSGCGKTTLLKILALLLKPEAGSYYFDGKIIDFDNSQILAKYRNQKIGYIMQDYTLISGMTVYENILLPMLIAKKKSLPKLEKIIKYMGLQQILEKRVEHISGGERQRTAIARAMVMQPMLLLADEPTSALDKENAIKIMVLFENIMKEFGSTVIIATHDERIIKENYHIIELAKGK